MFVLSPMSNCASPQHRDRFLGLLSAVAKTTAKSEPKALAYAWFRSAGDNDAVPHHWVRGLEVYEDLAALTETHRSSAEYKSFRTAVGNEGLLDRPSDLRFLQPTGIGFLTRSTDHEADPNQDFTYIVIVEVKPRSDDTKECLMVAMRRVAEAASSDEWHSDVLSLWALEYRTEYQDRTIMLFARFRSKDVKDKFWNHEAMSGFR